MIQPTILVVDDEKEIRELIEIYLPEPKRAPPAGSLKAIPAGALMFWYFNEA